jgi:U3 small nucleolar RNA-associated protein MPP10
MEAFADSEEEYHMPADDDDQEEEKVKKNDKKQSKKKYNDTLSSEEEEEENDSVDKEEKLVMGFRRKKFRSDEEIDALLSIYNENDHGEDDSEEDAVINMTAADFFGRPSSKYLASRKKAGQRHLYKPAKRENREDLEFDDNDGDSWGEQNLDNDGNDDLGWNAGSSGFDSDATADEEDTVTKDKAKPAQGNNNSELKGDMKQQSLKKLKLEEQTKQLESELLAEKPWAMRGETSGSSRPMNSLLEETPQFEVSSKVAPIITKEHSESIEAVIKQRILAEDWDVSCLCLLFLTYFDFHLCL